VWGNRLAKDRGGSLVDSISWP